MGKLSVIGDTNTMPIDMSVELTITHAGGTVVTQLPADASGQFPIGSCVRVSADRRDCRLLPDD